MQPKVSMVMPCYNKEAYIGNMFDSILAQKWDNIELILVDDGSTDGTRRVIAEYEPKFRARGFEVIIIYQENRGIPGTVYAGLQRVTGEFVCQVDCDDELDPEYVSAMAGWLAEHPEDQWVVCDICRTDIKGVSYILCWYRDFTPFLKRQGQQQRIEKYPYKLLESYLLQRICNAVWVAMARTGYLYSCGVLDGFIVEPRALQEPQIFIPLVLGGALPAYVRRPLYHHFMRDSSKSYEAKTHEARKKYSEEIRELNWRTLASKRECSKYDEIILRMGDLNFEDGVYWQMEGFDESDILNRLVGLIQESGHDDLSADKAIMGGFTILARWFTSKIIGYAEPPANIERVNKGRLIAYAAYGIAARRVKTGLLNSDIRPDVFWDNAAKEGDQIDGIPVVKPAFEELNENDVVMVLLVSAVAKDVGERLQTTLARDNIWYYYDVLDYLAEYYFGSWIK